jgi:transcriptional regulator with XRE-family HTH domain
VPRTELAQTLADLGAGIRKTREQRGLRQEDIAHRADIDYKRYQRIEAGSVNVTVRTLLRIAEALETDFWSLVRKRGK